jgi:hypothetical protein
MPADAICIVPLSTIEKGNQYTTLNSSQYLISHYRDCQRMRKEWEFIKPTIFAMARLDQLDITNLNCAPRPSASHMGITRENLAPYSKVTRHLPCS